MVLFLLVRRQQHCGTALVPILQMSAFLHFSERVSNERNSREMKTMGMKFAYSWLLLCVSSDPSAMQCRPTICICCGAGHVSLFPFVPCAIPAEDRELPDCVEDGGMLSSDDTNLFAFNVSLVWLSMNLLQDYVFK